MLISNIRENGEPIGALPDGEMDVPSRHDPMPKCPARRRCCTPSKFLGWWQHAVCERLRRL